MPPATVLPPWLFLWPGGCGVLDAHAERQPGLQPAPHLLQIAGVGRAELLRQHALFRQDLEAVHVQHKRRQHQQRPSMAPATDPSPAAPGQSPGTWGCGCGHRCPWSPRWTRPAAWSGSPSWPRGEKPAPRPAPRPPPARWAARPTTRARPTAWPPATPQPCPPSAAHTPAPGPPVAPSIPKHSPARSLYQGCRHCAKTGGRRAMPCHLLRLLLAPGLACR